MYEEKYFHIFLSHKHEDEKLAIKLKQEIEQKFSFKVWLDAFDEELGMKDAKALEIAPDRSKWEYTLSKILIDRLKRSAILMVLMTDNCYESKWIPYECGIAAGINKKTLVLKQNISKTTKTFEFISFWPPINNVKELERYENDIRKEYREITSNKSAVLVSLGKVDNKLCNLYDRSVEEAFKQLISDN